MSRSRGEGWSNLKLDRSFFQRIVQQDTTVNLEGVSPDYDIYLMESGVMPVVLQGLDALSRHVEKMEKSGGISGGGKAPFNPLTWLAQYLLRNHPGKVKDHRTPIYQQLSEMSSIERGRRGLLRRRPEMEEEWVSMEAEQGEPLGVESIPEYLGRLDARWLLNGALVEKLPKDYTGILAPSQDSAGLAFSDFWRWYNPYVVSRDLIRASVFDEAIQRQEEAERLERVAKEEQVRHELAMHEVIEVRKRLEDQFASISADLYTNDVITQIIKKTSALTGSGQERDGAAPTQGVHVELIVDMMRLWGCIAEPPPGDTWNAAAQDAWRRWTEAFGPEDGSPSAVESASLRMLMDREAFQAFLVKTYHAPETINQTLNTVEVRGIVEREHGDDDDDEEPSELVVEAVDEQTGEVHQYVLPEDQAEEVRRRLATAEADGEPVLARVDMMLRRVTAVLPPEE